MVFFFDKCYTNLYIFVIFILRLQSFCVHFFGQFNETPQKDMDEIYGELSWEARDFIIIQTLLFPKINLRRPNY